MKSLIICTNVKSIKFYIFTGSTTATRLQSLCVLIVNLILILVEAHFLTIFFIITLHGISGILWNSPKILCVVRCILESTIIHLENITGRYSSVAYTPYKIYHITKIVYFSYISRLTSKFWIRLHFNNSSPFDIEHFLFGLGHILIVYWYRLFFPHIVSMLCVFHNKSV